MSSDAASTAVNNEELTLKKSSIAAVAGGVGGYPKTLLFQSVDAEATSWGLKRIFGAE